jgi:hypothetical protein
VDWTKTRSRALGIGAALMALHASQSGALDAAASVGLYNHENVVPIRVRSNTNPTAPIDTAASDAA